MKKYLSWCRRIWIAAMLIALGTAHLFFIGSATSEVAGNLAFGLLVLCAPISVIAYPAALSAVSFFQPMDLHPYNSRLVLTLWWSIFFAIGFMQWFLVPLVWRKLRPNNAFKADVAKATHS